MISEKVQELEYQNAHLIEENEELRKMLGREPEKPMNCESCVFFIQHYVKVTGGYMKTYCGHCAHGRCKDRKPENKSCQYFQLGKYQ